MKENKFKIWCEFEFEGELIKTMEGSESWFLLTQTGKLWTYEPDSAPRPLDKAYKVAIPLFYTGFTDKDGTEIYEGDIVGGTHDYPDEVIWSDERGQWMLDNGINPDDTLWEIHRDNDIEIIGNIYENPALIAAKKTSQGK